VGGKGHDSSTMRQYRGEYLFYAQTISGSPESVDPILQKPCLVNGPPLHQLRAPVLHRPFASDKLTTHLLPSHHVSHVKRPDTSTEPLVRAMQTFQEGL